MVFYILFNHNFSANFSLMKLNKQSFLLNIPIFLLSIYKFLRQLPLEDYHNAKINSLNDHEVFRKKLRTGIVDVLIKCYLLFILYLFVTNFYSEFDIELNDFKVKIFFGLNLFITISHICLLMFALLSPYLTWFMLSRISSVIFLLNFPTSFYVFSLNLFAGFLNEIGLEERIWKENIEYSLFVKVSKFIYLTSITRFLAYYIF